MSNIKENGQPIGLGDAGAFWHSDLSYKDKPSLGSMLHAQELPVVGGDTLFANQHAAYDALPDALKRTLDGKQDGAPLGVAALGVLTKGHNVTGRIRPSSGLSYRV